MKNAAHGNGRSSRFLPTAKKKTQTNLLQRQKGVLKYKKKKLRIKIPKADGSNISFNAFQCFSFR
jgi:hypothetical protein